MPVTLFFGLLTLTPLALALVIGVLGVARLARAPVALGVAALGALTPMVGLALLAPDILPNQLTQVALLTDPSGAATQPFAPVYSLDTIGIYCAFGVAFILTPLLLWVAWRAAPSVASAATNDAELAADATADAPLATGPWLGSVGRWQWVGLALALALESAALSLCFAENILWLALCWLLVVALAWGLGELGAEADTLDWVSLGGMALGPVAWLVIILLVALPAKHWRLLDLMDAGGFAAGHVVALGIALACAGGAYPFLAWLRRRAAFAMPAGVIAVTIGVIPVTLLVGARTYSALRDLTDRWPVFPLGVPPITAGIVMTLLGGASVFIAGLLALGRRDGRGLVALLALAQVGWGLIALGVGQPISALGLVVLLATSVLGLGAALAALVAGGALAADEEPPSAGPRAFGARLHAPTLFAWCVGVASLVGAPLFAGFAPQELISAAALPTTKLGIPLVGIAWAGDALLALALARATALAFSQSSDEIKAIRDRDAALDAALNDSEDADEDMDAAGSDADDEEDTDDATVAASAGRPAARGLPGLPELAGDDLPGVILALLIIALGVAPEWLFSLGGLAAAGDLLHTDALLGFTQTGAAGYSTVIGAQWLPGLAAWVAVLLIVLLVLLQARGARAVRPLYLAGQSTARLATFDSDTQPGDATQPDDDLFADEDTVAPDASGAAEPAEAWSDLQPAMTSAWLTPGAQWIVVENDEGDEDEASGEDEAGEDEAGEDEAGEDEAGEDEADEDEADEDESDEETIDKPDISATSARGERSTPTATPARVKPAAVSATARAATPIVGGRQTPVTPVTPVTPRPRRPRPHCPRRRRSQQRPRHLAPRRPPGRLASLPAAPPRGASRRGSRRPAARVRGAGSQPRSSPLAPRPQNHQ